MRQYTKSENTAELHIMIDPLLLQSLKEKALKAKKSLGQYVRELLAK